MVWKSTTLFVVIKVKKHWRKHPWGLINDQHMNVSQRLFKIVPNEEKLTSRACLTSYLLHTLLACSDKSTNRTSWVRLGVDGGGALSAFCLIYLQENLRYQGQNCHTLVNPNFVSINK